jgi:hypothetical protein
MIYLEQYFTFLDFKSKNVCVLVLYCTTRAKSIFQSLPLSIINEKIQFFKWLPPTIYNTAVQPDSKLGKKKSKFHYSRLRSKNLTVQWLCLLGIFDEKQIIHNIRRCYENKIEYALTFVKKLETDLCVFLLGWFFFLLLLSFCFVCYFNLG